MFGYYSNVVIDIWLVWVLFTAATWITIKSIQFWLKLIKGIHK